MVVVGLVGAALWGFAYVALSGYLDATALTRLFFFGAVSIPISHALERLWLAALAPRGGPEKRVRGSGRGIRSGAQEQAEAADAKEHALYFRDLKVSAAIRLAFVILLYQLVARHTAHPIAVLVVGSVVFALAIPRHAVLRFRRREEPAAYKEFVFARGSFAHRCATLGVALGVQLGLMLLV